MTHCLLAALLFYFNPLVFVVSFVCRLQVEYAVQAAEKGGLTIGVQSGEGLVLAAQGRRRSPLLKRESVSKITDLDTCISCAMSGLLPDGRLMADFAR